MTLDFGYLPESLQYPDLNAIYHYWERSGLNSFLNVLADSNLADYTLFHDGRKSYSAEDEESAHIEPAWRCAHSSIVKQSSTATQAGY